MVDFSTTRIVTENAERQKGLGKEKKNIQKELSEFFKRELSVKMGDDYHFEVSWHLGKKGGGRIYKRGTFWDIYNLLDFMSSYVAFCNRLSCETTPYHSISI